MTLAMGHDLFTWLAVAGLSLAVLACIAAVWSRSVREAYLLSPRRRAPLHLQESLVTSTVVQTSGTTALVPDVSSSVPHSALVGFVQAAVAAELCAFAFGSARVEAAMRAGAFAILAIALEVEYGQRLATIEGPLECALWRARAAMRCATAIVLSVARLWPASADEENDAAPSIETLGLGVLAAAIALALALSLLRGPPVLLEAPAPVMPMRNAWVLPKLLFTWWWPQVWRIVRVDRRSNREEGEPLAVDDLPQLDPKQMAAACWQAASDVRERRVRSKARHPSLLPELWKVGWAEASLMMVWSSFGLVANYFAPIGMLGLIAYVDTFTGGPIEPRAYAYGLLVALGPLVATVGDVHTFNIGWVLATKMRAYLTHAVSEKALTLDAAATDQTVGQMSNLLSVDANNVVQFCPFASWLWLEGVQLLGTLGVLYYIQGVAAMGGLAVCLLAFPLNAVVLRWIEVLQERLMKQKDARMALVSEAVTAIRTVKLNGWEPEFEGRIAKLRAQEVRTLLRLQKLEAITSTMWLTTPTLAAVASFLIKSLWLGESISAAEGFTSLTLFQLLSVSLNFLPDVINMAIQANVGLRRVSRFLNLPDVDGRAPPEALRMPPGAAAIRNGSFQWKQPPPSEQKAKSMSSKWCCWQAAAAADDDDSEAPNENSKPNRDGAAGGEDEAGLGVEPLVIHGGGPRKFGVDLLEAARSGGEGVAGVEEGSAPPIEGCTATAAPSGGFQLRGVDLHLAPNKLTVVYGPTGSGKSTLLSALLGDCPATAGAVAINGRASYCPQKAWVANATLRDNVLFGQPFEQNRYDQVIEACALRSDIAQLPKGDLTEIGERGVNLSGGQQQRVNLARACYSRASIVILDDVLSAVDAHVGAHIFERCILGWLGGRTRVLVSHAVALTMARADSVVVVKLGRVVAQGSPTSTHPEIMSLASFSPSSSPVVPRRTLPSASPAAKTAPVPSGGAPSAAIGSTAAASSGTAAATSINSGTAGGKIIKKEERAKGAAKLKIYVVYLRAAGGLWFALGFCLLLAVYSSLNPVQSVALKQWMQEMEVEGAPISSGRVLRACGLYVAAACGFVFITLCRNVLLPYASVRASRGLHGGMMHAVLRARISWFEATPVGRILNRFSSDISAIDQKVAYQFKDTIGTLFNCLSIALVCFLGSSELASQLVVLAAVASAWVISYAVFRQYRIAARELKRLESVTKSPLLAFFSEMISGAAVVRAFGDETRTLDLADTKVNDANRTLYYLWCTNQWLRIYMNAIGSLVTTAVVATVLWQGAQLNGGDAGLTLSYATQFTQAIMWLFRIYTQLEVSMNDVERVDEYTSTLPTEQYDASPHDAGAEATKEANHPSGAHRAAVLSSSWPADGAIEFRNVRLQYASANEPVFSSLSFRVAPRQRVGVVGRTGAGKSSLTVALFRAVELSGGSITIDGIDHRHVDLGRLRRSLSIIQQEPVLFQGTVRYNMAPVGKHTDEELWHALERAGLAPKIRSLVGGLAFEVAEGGSNFSAGERQLLCMARALLRRTSVLVMDEATASVDHATDARIQEMVKRDFRGNTTVFTVAHRLNTVVFYDRILMLSQGSVLEYAPPLELLTTAEGAFRKLAEESGDLEGLMQAARESAADTGVVVEQNSSWISVD